MPQKYYPPFNKLSRDLNEVINDITKAIDGEGIRYGIFAGVAAKLYGSNRELSDDVDLMVKDENLKPLRRAFEKYGAILRHYESTDIVSHMVSFEINGVGVDIVGNCKILEEFEYIPDDLMLSKRRVLNMSSEHRVAIASPEDVFVFKALSQRGRDIGKFDIDDAIAVFDSQGFDFQYVEERARLCNGYNRVKEFIEKI